MKKRYLKTDIILNKNIGDIDSDREEAISEILGKNFPNKINISQVNGIAFISIQNDSIVITNQQISYQSQIQTQDGVGRSIEIKSYLDKICKRLAISQKGIYSINIEYLVEAKRDTFDETKKDYLKNENLKLSLRGIGIKNFIENEKIMGFLAIEPYLNDSNYYFIAVNIQTKSNLDNFNDAFEIFREYRDLSSDYISNVTSNIK